MESGAPEPSLYTVKALFILDNDDNRLLAKYYDPKLYPSMKEQRNFEKHVFNKTHKTDSEIAFLEGMTIVYKSSIDLFLYVVGSANENEEPSLYTVKALFILDNDDNRLLAKYYDPKLYPSMKEQRNFEKHVFNKTHKTDSEIAFLEGMTIVYKSSIDLFLYVVGSANENEKCLVVVFYVILTRLSPFPRKNVEKRSLVENLDGVFLVVDEIVDGGVILESDPQQVIQKVNFKVR
ncbi:UNVERIFIED_CONTAM: hypothetical protein FKN15_064857 [Acipenser sinensis]